MATLIESSLIISINSIELNTEKIVLTELPKTTRRKRAKKEAVEAEKKRIARGKKISRAVASLMYADFASGYKISGAAKQASKAVVKKVLSDMMVKSQYRQETKNRYYVPFAEI